MEPQYVSREKRTPDDQYKERLEIIRKKGRWTKSRYQTEGTFTHLNVPSMEFNLSNGFPILTERKIGFWRKPIQELFAFLNGVRNAKILAEEWGVNWWMEKWATPEKCGQFELEPYDMGIGSYGPGFTAVPHTEWERIPGHPDGGKLVSKPFNQITNLIQGIIDRPELRTHVIKNWTPQYCLQHDGLQRKVVVAPCHGDLQITIIDSKMTLRMTQRSADYPIGIPSNMIQYAALTLAIGSLTGHEPETFIHATNDSQIYERHLEDVDELLRRKSFPFPTMHLTEEGKSLTDLRDFRGKHFVMDEYESHPAMTLKDAVV